MTPAQVNDPYTQAAQEDRCGPRIKLKIPAMLRPSGASAFQTTLIDLSIGGFAAQTVTSMRTGSLCWLTVGTFKGLQAEVVWNDGQVVGCAFATLLNPAVFDSIVNGADLPPRRAKARCSFERSENNAHARRRTSLTLGLAPR